MKYVERVFLAFGLAIVLVLLFWFFVGGNDVLQYANKDIVNEYFVAVLAFATAVAAVVALASAVLAVAAVAAVLASVATAVLAVAAVAANFGLGVGIAVFLCLSLFFSVEIYFTILMEKKKLEKNYWITFVILAILFVIGVAKTPVFIEWKAERIMENTEIEGRLIEKENEPGSIGLLLESEKEGKRLANHLYYEILESDSLVQNKIDYSVIKISSEHINDRFQLWWPEQEGDLYFFSYDKRRKIEVPN